MNASSSVRAVIAVPSQDVGLDPGHGFQEATDEDEATGAPCEGPTSRRNNALDRICDLSDNGGE